MSSSDPDFQQAFLDFKKGGWIVSMLGLAGGLVAMLLSEEHHPKVVWFKRILAGGLTGVIMFFSLHGVDMNPLYKSVLMCASGSVALELFRGFKAAIKGMFNRHEKRKRKAKR